jgi:tetratricopeptide (TPR) repeat protein
LGQTDSYLSHLSRDERQTLYRFAAFPDHFSVDWFKDIDDVKPSHLLAVISFLLQRKWITSQRKTGGIYKWTTAFQREFLLNAIPPEEASRYYREAVNVLIKALPAKEENTLKIARACLLAGLEPSDLGFVLTAALHEESHHKIASSIKLYDHLLEYMERQIDGQDQMPSGELCRTLITAIERRASLSLLHPNTKKIKPWLVMAKQVATQCGDTRSQASLELLIGQNCWMSFQYDQAVNHFDRAWDMIKDIEDSALQKRGLQLRGLSHWIRGDLSMALQSYEDSLGELDHISDDDFSLLTGLHLSQCYTQVGMPQRALGISETIYHQAIKNSNGPIVSFALANTGLILLEMKQLKDSRSYFEKALDMSRRESIPMAELLAGIGLSNIECLEGRYEQAAEHFKVLYRIRKSSWYHTLNASHIFEPGFILFQKGISPVELNPVIRFLNEIRKEQLNPILYGIIRRLQIQHLESGMRPKDKITELVGIETALEKSGALLALAKVRIDIARLFLDIIFHEGDDVVERLGGDACCRADLELPDAACVVQFLG